MTSNRAKLCGLLSEVFPSDLNAFYFASSGSEANEAAMTMARRFTGRTKIMTRYRSYHGGTRNSLAVTGDYRTWGVDSSTPGNVKLIDPYPFHSSWDSDPTVGIMRCLDQTHEQILFEGPQNIAGILLEPITGANGWLHHGPEYLQGIRALCDKYGIMMIADEVMTGFGRSGKMFGF